ncbi:MAG: acetyl-CoA carboxylase biotin carboxyl carrier protein [Planctomycetes bacterium]|nr:acetyl-CoA carboxylase biotin carboxyl carrier protein [Planctomycetota bacterium]
MAAKRSSKKKSPTKQKPAPRAAAGKKAASPRKSAADERLEQLERLVEMMVQKDVVEVELEEAGARWRVRRTEPHAVTYAAPAMPLAAPMMHAPMMAGGAAQAHGAHAGSAAAEPQGEVFKSPMLGTYYQSPSPDAEAFVKVGDRVNADTTLCIIEAMKVMNEIKAEREFEILDVLVKNGEPVEYGQPLFLIR